MYIGPSSYINKFKDKLHWFWCDCGEIVLKRKYSVTSGHVSSCGCIEKERKHGFSCTPTHNAWTIMKQRCNNKKSSNYKYYGGLGIKICDKWNDSFLEFLNDMGEKPKDKKYLSRKDKTKDFLPENCFWTNFIVIFVF